MHPRATAQQRLLTIALLSRPPRAHALLGGLRRSFSDSVAIKYEPHRNDPALFNPAAISAWLHPEFQSMLAAVRDADTMDLPTESIVRDHVNEEARDIYSFPLLSDEACDRLIAEVDNFHATGLPARRPNSMNNYGLILNEIGLKPSLSALQQQVHEIAKSLFPLEGKYFDDHHCFIVSYKPDEDKGLDMHTDDSDVTLNVCLGKEFEAAGLTFCGDMGTPSHRQQSFQYRHTRGRALLHLGRRRHGADDITSGHRMNLIMWNWNREYRQSPAYVRRTYSKEDGQPDAMCVSWTHDRDYEVIVGEERPSTPGKRKGDSFAETAWCPPPFAEYEGFAGEGGRYRDRLADPLDSS